MGNGLKKDSRNFENVIESVGNLKNSRKQGFKKFQNVTEAS
jgi:hypothetical protein